MTKEQSLLYDRATAEAWDKAVETFKRRLAWAAANNPRAIDRLVANVADVVKNAAPDVAASGSGKNK